MPLTDKTMLVCGGGDIGTAIVEQALAAGARIIVWDRDLTSLKASKLADKITATQVDVSNNEAVQQAFADLETAGSLPDILVNGAGVFTHLLPVEALEPDDFWEVMHNNLGSCLLTTGEALRRCADGLNIINISSAMSQRPIPMASAYSASKAGIDSLTRSVAIEYAARGIRANAVNPGPVEGGLLDRGIQAIAEVMQFAPSDILGKILEGLPQGRVVTAKEVAALVVFLAGDATASINGQTINICGGYAM